jgi:hypothetical protein
MHTSEQEMRESLASAAANLWALARSEGLTTAGITAQLAAHLISDLMSEMLLRNERHAIGTELVALLTIAAGSSSESD